jgi:hypothetical protein
MSDIERDAARYRWIKAAPRLRIERMPDSHYWISTETGEKYSVTHTLSAFDTGFSGLPTLDELVDQAMEMYPIPKTNDSTIRFSTSDSEIIREIIRIDKHGFHYRGQFIEDAGEAHRLLVEFLRTQMPETNSRHADD